MTEAQLTDAVGLHVRLRRLMHQFTTKVMGPLEMQAPHKEIVRLADRLDALGVVLDKDTVDLKPAPHDPMSVA